MIKYIKLTKEAREKYENLGYLRTKKLARFFDNFDLNSLPEEIDVEDMELGNMISLSMSRETNKRIMDKAKDLLVSGTDLYNYIIINYLE